MGLRADNMAHIYSPNSGHPVYTLDPHSASQGVCSPEIYGGLESMRSPNYTLSTLTQEPFSSFTSFHDGRMYPSVSQSPYEGTQCPSLCESSGDQRRPSILSTWSASSAYSSTLSPSLFDGGKPPSTSVSSVFSSPLSPSLYSSPEIPRRASNTSASEAYPSTRRPRGPSNARTNSITDSAYGLGINPGTDIADAHDNGSTSGFSYLTTTSDTEVYSPSVFPHEFQDFDFDPLSPISKEMLQNGPDNNNGQARVPGWNEPNLPIDLFPINSEGFFFSPTTSSLPYQFPIPFTNPLGGNQDFLVSPISSTIPYPSPFSQDAPIPFPPQISNQPPEPPRIPIVSVQVASSNHYRQEGPCPLPSCNNKVFKDLRAHMLNHEPSRPEKCPFVNCVYYNKGFARKYDMERHVLTHFKGSMVCDLCPPSGDGDDSGPDRKRCFNRPDVLRRHLATVHPTAEPEFTPLPPKNRRRTSRAEAEGRGDKGTGSKKRRSSESPNAAMTAKSSSGLAAFGNAQELCGHHGNYVLSRVAHQAYQQGEDEHEEEYTKTSYAKGKGKRGYWD